MNHEEEEAYAVNIPRYLQNEKRCREAKEEELQKFLDFEVYSECIDEGQPRLGTNWVLTEKVTDEGTRVKARLTVRGSVPTRSDFLGLWSAIGLFGANWSEKGPILRSKVRF